MVLFRGFSSITKNQTSVRPKFIPTWPFQLGPFHLATFQFGAFRDRLRYPLERRPRTSGLQRLQTTLLDEPWFRHAKAVDGPLPTAVTRPYWADGTNWVDLRLRGGAIKPANVSFGPSGCPGTSAKEDSSPRLPPRLLPPTRSPGWGLHFKGQQKANRTSMN